MVPGRTHQERDILPVDIQHTLYSSDALRKEQTYALPPAPPPTQRTRTPTLQQNLPPLADAFTNYPYQVTVHQHS